MPLPLAHPGEPASQKLGFLCSVEGVTGAHGRILGNRVSLREDARYVRSVHHLSAACPKPSQANRAAGGLLLSGVPGVIPVSTADPMRAPEKILLTRYSLLTGPSSDQTTAVLSPMEGSQEGLGNPQSRWVTGRQRPQTPCGMHQGKQETGSFRTLWLGNSGGVMHSAIVRYLLHCVKVPEVLGKESQAARHLLV